MKIAIGHWNSTPGSFCPDVESDEAVAAEARRQAAARPDDPCLGVRAVEDFETLYNEDVKGDYALDPALYWIRFIRTEGGES